MVLVTICRVPPNPRYLYHRRTRKLLGISQDDTTHDQLPPLDPNEEQLYSYWVPSLPAGKYTINASQIIQVVGHRSIEAKSAKELNVVASRFSLPQGSIHSVYPPQGHADENRILPHIVFNDPHLPWERLAQKGEEADHQSNRIPWLAVVAFTQPELQFPESGREPGISGSVRMKVEDVRKISGATHPLLTKTTPNDDKIEADWIFVPTGLFQELFRDPSSSAAQQKCSVSGFKYMAHIRNINTMGMANSGIDGESGTFSVVVSPRTGSLEISQPTTVAVHLVNLEGIADMDWNISATHVSLCSLESWTYTCLPPGSFNVYTGLQHLGNTRALLRPDPKIVDAVKERSPRLAARLNDGYVLTRYRTQTGEETAAIFRGAFVPTIQSHIQTPMSNFGTDLQVMDVELGLMDITYSVAWQLGKGLALADQSFTTALSRIRFEIGRQGRSKTVQEAYKTIGHFHEPDIERSLLDIAAGIHTLGLLPPDRIMRGPASRWRVEHDITQTIDSSFDGDLMRAHFLENARPAAENLAGSTTEDSHYTEFNDPQSPDWKIVLAWVLDRMYLSGIPAHYLLPDPSFLPQESLRFFHIDRRWIDSLIDGALSVANHMQHDDQVRTALKDQINTYLSRPVSPKKPAPQIPSYGFLIRSELCIKYPDLIVEAPYPSDPAGKTPILRQENIDDGVLLTLFDRMPGDSQLPTIILRQPPHQQAFAVGAELDTEKLVMEYKRVTTTPPGQSDDSSTGFQRIYTPTDTDDAKRIFNWKGEKYDDVHMLRLPQFATETYNVITMEMEGKFEEDCATAALIGIQLNDPMYYLELGAEIKDQFSSSDPAAKDDDHDDGNLRTLKMIEPHGGRSIPMSPLPKYARLSRTDPFGDQDWLQPLPSPLERLEIAASTAVPEDVDIPAPESGTAPATAKSPLEQAIGPSSAPRFSYQVFPLGSPKKDVSEVPILYPSMEQDLVFHIKLTTPPDNWELKEIKISIRIGDTSAKRRNLTQNYRGPGAVMLSNLRFNVIAISNQETHNGSKEDRLLLRLIPRRNGKFASIQRDDEMSFVLSGVRVNQYSEETDVYVWVSEVYYQRPETTTNFNITLIPKKRGS